MTIAAPQRRRPGHLRRRRARRLAAGVLLCGLTLCAGCGQASPGKALPASSGLPASRASHVIVVLMENDEYGEVIGNAAAPYIGSLVKRYGLMTRSYAIRHPSLPNYVALTSGSTHGIDSDCTDCTVAGANIADQLDAARLSWKAYLEDLPSPCFTGASSGGYAKKHNPFAYYPGIAGSPSRCRGMVGFGALSADLRAGTLPTYAWISPNLCDDGHDCPISTADRFLARTLPSLLRELGPHGFLVLTWDEGSGGAASCCGVAHGGHVATIVAGPDVRRGARSSTPIDSYGVLGSIEQALGLPPLGGARDRRSGRLNALFTKPPHVR